MSNIIANILGSQSNSSSMVFRSLIEFLDYVERVAADSGVIVDYEEAKSFYINYVEPYGGDISLAWASSGGFKTGKLYSIKPFNGSGDFTVVRASIRTRINELGVEESVPANTPVIDWSTGSPLLSIVDDLITLTTPSNCTKVVITVNGVDTEYNNVFPTLTLPIGSISKIIAVSGGVEYDLLRDYLLRVSAATGSTNEQGAKDLKAMYEFLDDEGLLANTELLYLANAGMVQRTDGILKFVRTAFDASTDNRDLNGSATATQQPRLVGGIAPNSKPAAANLNGEGRYFTHPAISFGANDAWSVTVVLKWDGNNEQFVALAGGNSTGAGRNHIAIRRGNANVWAFFNDFQIGNFIGSDNTSNYIGKNIIATFSVNGGNNIKAFVNGIEKGSLDIATNFNFSSVFTPLSELATQAKLKGSISAYHIQSGALIATQVTALHNTLRGMYPEIESVQIGTQTWASRNFEAVATPVGNVIANVTENGAVEKITNAADREFSSDTGFWNKSTNSLINGGVGTVVSLDGSTAFIRRTSSLLTIGKWYKITVEIKRIGAGGLRFTDASYAVNITNSVGVQTVYFKPMSTNLFGFYNLPSTITDIDIDNVSIQELNWSNATEIYDAVYAATSGTTAQKEYAALKEAAMWCYYNNAPANGAIYGKLYNWYAAKLLDLDMVTAGFGWRVPTSAQFTTLATALGGASVAGGKMKMTGTNYWNTPNTGATNESGFTFLPSGRRSNTGTFGFINIYGISWSSDSINVSIGKVITCYNLDDDLLIQNDEKLRGMQIRLIKD